MIVRYIDDLHGTERDVQTEHWRSLRLLLKKDNVGFSLHDTSITAGSELVMHYKHHIEAVYCIEGEGLLTDVVHQIEYKLLPGTLYTLDGHEKHVLKAESAMRMICVFNPPVIGDEVHGEDGAYPASVDSKAQEAI